MKDGGEALTRVVKHDDDVVYGYVDVCLASVTNGGGSWGARWENTALYALGAVADGGFEAGERVLGEAGGSLLRVVGNNAGQELAQEKAEPSHTPRWPQHSGMALGFGAGGVEDMTDKEKAAERGRMRRVKEEGLRMREGRREPDRGRVVIAEAMVGGGTIRRGLGREEQEEGGEGEKQGRIIDAGQRRVQATDAVSTSPPAAAGRLDPHAHHSLRLSLFAGHHPDARTGAA